ncbi:glycosyltransferase family 71 protein [Myriangium duriaei CBS 260.36]|uniref:Glycosyltransferase family 71 protein n=1 Tax=Myriangium duriaei CBS 260.36 TaxID=1168546 RepID=A0A9P4J713_9PEZI|nr:glycosyltransferase family 71 protein [Myriangium duriaei CBS 260.36]
MGKAWHGAPTRRDTRNRNAVVALAIVLFLAISTILVRHREHDSGVLDHHEKLSDALNSIEDETLVNATIGDFGSKARKVAALADLAELHTEQPSLNHTLLASSITEQFPWWNPDTLSYIPWRSRRTFEPWAKGQHQAKTGIVISVGEPLIWEAAHLISSLRNVLRSKLPIQIAYAGDADLSPARREFLSTFGNNLEFIDLTTVFDDSIVGFKGWAMKPFAILASRYPRTILVDADMLFFHAPDKIFEKYQGLKDTGALYFKDRAIYMFLNGRNGWLKDQLDNAGREPSKHLTHDSLFWKMLTSEEADSAMVAVDLSRPRQYLTMLFTAWMNSNETRAFTYKMFYGDKETYWISNELTGTPYAFEPWSAAQLATNTTDDGKETADRHCTSHMAHALPDGSDIFWANGGIWRDKRYKMQGFVSFKDWFLGQRIDESIASINFTAEGSKEKLALTQPIWAGKQQCSQHNQTAWMPLSAYSKKINEKLIGEARLVERAFAALKTKEDAAELISS